MKQEKLVFIISQPRAGSTLLQKLLSNNKMTETVSEPWLLLPLLHIYEPSLVKAKYNNALAMEGFSDYISKKELDTFLKTGLRRLILELYQPVSSENYFIDKTPRNYELLGKLMEFFPEARFIVLKRDPFAALASMITTWTDQQLKYDQLQPFTRDFLKAPFLIQEFCEKYAHKANVRIVNYEALVKNTREEVKAVYEWLNLPFNEEVLRIGENEKVKGMFGDDAQKKDPLKEVTVKKEPWEELLKSKEMAFFFLLYEKQLGADLLKRYGYPGLGDLPERKEVTLPRSGVTKVPAGPGRKRFIHSFFGMFGLEVKRRVNPAPVKAPGPEQKAAEIMRMCLADIDRVI
jgi:hypothetical protein